MKGPKQEELIFGTYIQRMHHIIGITKAGPAKFLDVQAGKNKILSFLVQGKPANMRVPNKQDPLSLGLPGIKRTTYLGLIIGLPWSPYLWKHLYNDIGTQTTTGGGGTTPHPMTPNPTTQCPNRLPFFCYLGVANWAEYFYLQPRKYFLTRTRNFRPRTCFLYMYLDPWDMAAGLLQTFCLEHRSRSRLPSSWTLEFSACRQRHSIWGLKNFQQKAKGSRPSFRLRFFCALLGVLRNQDPPKPHPPRSACG